ncbi:MAG: hypothetical protein LUG51_07165 [Tannerellaceae bacterium]|nr:hypothetical protein [Tannerellaceae bacterium]
MGKKYEYEEMKPEERGVSEPMMEYLAKPKLSPALTEEDMQELITGDELIEYMDHFIDELFDKKK